MLVDAYDGAFIHPMENVPSTVRIILGYVGGPGAYHIWSTADAQKVKDSGRRFWPIWVPPQGRALRAQDGIDAARGMLAALPIFNVSKSSPCFMDIEYSQYHLNPQGASLATSTFQATLSSAGYLQPFSYAPSDFGRGWISKYTYEKPDVLPAGVIGWQYENDKFSHAGWDASVFDSTLLGKSPSAGWNIFDMDYAVIIRRLNNEKIYRCNLLDGTCEHLLNAAAVAACKKDLDAANIPYTSDTVNDISAYVEITR